MTELNKFSLLANAKINLYLDITGRRCDGYHTIETVMQSVDLADTIMVKIDKNGGDISVTCSNPLIPEGCGNICYKAAERFYEAVGERYETAVHIEKRIPHGAGLGGGSADAAAVLVALNRLCGKGKDCALSEEKLLEIGVLVGADVPFCMTGGTRLCRGIGEQMSEISPFPKRVFLIVMPDFSCDTKAAYRAYDENPVPARSGVEDFLKSEDEFPKRMYNVFSTLYADERIDSIKRRLLECGAQGAELSGSGAVVFGVFADKQSAQAAAKHFPKYFTAVSEPALSCIISLSK